MDLLPFQSRFVGRALAPGIRTAAFSLPRGNGKSTLVAWLAKRALTPGDELFVPGAESYIVAKNIGQARRTVFKQLVAQLGDADDYRIAQSHTACHVIEKAHGTRITVLPSDKGSDQGLVGMPFIFADEPGSWNVAGGEDVYDAIEGAHGKPGSVLRTIYCGTLAPALSGWWHDLVRGGSNGSTYVQALEGNRDRWDRASEIRRCNPLKWAFPESRKVLFEDRDKARSDTRKKAKFWSDNLNIPTGDESKVLLTAADWEMVEARPVPERVGRPICAIDMGEERAWSAAVALWRNGRIEARATTGGVVPIADQERRDRVPGGVYQRLVDTGVLQVATGLHQPTAAMVIDHVRRWNGEVVLCDFARLGEVKDALGDIPFVARRTGYLSADEDIRATRRLAQDGNLAVTPSSRGLLRESVLVAQVQHENGLVKLKKAGTNNQARDDVAAALVLACGALARAPAAEWPGHMVCG